MTYSLLYLLEIQAFMLKGERSMVEKK